MCRRARYTRARSARRRFSFRQPILWTAWMGVYLVFLLPVGGAYAGVYLAYSWEKRRFVVSTLAPKFLSQSTLVGFILSFVLLLSALNKLSFGIGRSMGDTYLPHRRDLCVCISWSWACLVAAAASCRCIGRIAWNTLVVRDKRHVTDLAEMFAECMEHQRLAMADGRRGSVEIRCSTIMINNADLAQLAHGRKSGLWFLCVNRRRLQMVCGRDDPLGRRRG